jgi:hypothetical protein
MRLLWHTISALSIHAKAPIKQACKLVFSRAAGAQRANARSGGM